MGIMDVCFHKEKKRKKIKKNKEKLEFRNLELCFYFCFDGYLLFGGIHKGVLYGFCAELPIPVCG